MNPADDDFSETGFLILCDHCCQHTATHKTGTDYACDACVGDESFEEVKDDVDKTQEVKVCDCGAIKGGGLHSDWCSTNE